MQQIVISSSSDAWYTYMQNEGYKFNSSRQIASDQFMLYREKIEHLQPIAPELRLLGLQYLPQDLLHWASCKTIVQEVLALRDFLKTTNRDEAEKLQGILILLSIVLIHNLISQKAICRLMKCCMLQTMLALPLPSQRYRSIFLMFIFISTNSFRKQLALLLLWRKQKANALTHLIRTYSKRNISQQEYGFLLNEREELMVKLSESELKNTIEVDDMSYVSVNQFVGWLVSCPKFLNFQVREF